MVAAPKAIWGYSLKRKVIFRHRAVRWTIYYIVFIATFLLAGKQEEFIYFQF